MPRTPASPFEQLEYYGESITVNTTGKILVLPTGNADVLPSFNEYTLNSNRLTVEESPFGGLKGSQSPDYAPGTLYTATDGVVIQDTSMGNQTQTMTAGKLKELSLLTIDTHDHTIKEEFIVANARTSNNPTVIDGCNSTTNWSLVNGAGTLDIDTTDKMAGVGSLTTVTGVTDASGLCIFKYNPTTINLSSANFTTFSIKSSLSGTLYFRLFTDASNYALWSGSRFPISANTWTAFVLPIRAPAGSSGQNPAYGAGNVNYSNVDFINIGIDTPGNNESITLHVDNVTADVAKSAYIELQTPDFLADTSAQIYCYTGAAYELWGSFKMDSAYSAISTDATKLKFLDGTVFSDVYGSGNGRACFPKGVSGQTVSGVTNTMTYSGNKGTKNRIGLRVDLPPSDGGRTSFNKIRFKTILYYSDINKATNILPDLSGNGNNGAMDRVGLVADNLGVPYGAMKFDGVSSYVDCGNTNILQITGAITLTGWIKLNDTTLSGALAGRGYALASNGNYGYFLSFYGTSKQLSFDIYSTTTRNRVYFSNAITDTNWHHIAATWDGTTNANSLALYVDNIKVAQAQATITQIGIPNYNFRIGRDSVNNYPLNGQIGNIRVYSRSLFSEEVTALYHNQTVSSIGLVASWKPVIVANMGSTSYEFSDSTSASHGLQNLVKPWIALYDPASSEIDFFLFTYRPKALISKRDETGNIHELTLYPGNWSIYHGRLTHCNPALDSDSNLIPDCLESSVEGSITKFLQTYGFFTCLLTTSEGDFLLTSEGETLEVL